MYRSFAPSLVRPNLPLRKPLTSPMTHCLPAPPRHAGPNVTPVHPAPGAIGDGPNNSPESRDTSVAVGSVPPALNIYFCNYCGQQGKFRCKRCKKTPYCSVACQTEDWRAHRHLCKSIEPELTKENPKETVASHLPGDRAEPPVSKSDESSLQRIYLKDLLITKVIKGANIQASLVEFYSPSRFFLIAQSPELLEALQNIGAELKKTYSCPSVTTYVPLVGEVCAVQFSSDLVWNWYRGLVQTWDTDQKRANVLYIDFGNQESVPVERIKPLTANIQPFAPCAMECCIAKVVPVSGTWSAECCITLRQLLAGKTMTVELMETLDQGRIHVVDILLSMGKYLSTFLINNGYAVEETVNTTPTQQEINAMVSASLENFKRFSDGKDDNSWAQPPEPLTLAVGDSFSVLVTHLQSPGEIIVQKVENAGVIQELQLKLREHCSQVPAPDDFRPAPGTVCCAQFSEDKQWYRAKVLAYSSEERVCVGYLDFGNSEEVDLGHLLPISSSLLALPMQAMPCGLAGMQPIGESWSDDCLLALRRMVSNRILRIEIQGAQEGKALVSMINEASDPQDNVAELLCSAGYAASTPIPALNPAPGPPPGPAPGSASPPGPGPAPVLGSAPAPAPATVTPSHDQQTDQTTTTVTVEPHVPTSACEPLVWSFTELPTDGQTVALLASVVENPQEFYCRINNPADHQRLIELGAELKQHCEAKAHPSAPKVGEPCCALFPGDNSWHRAMVNGLSDDKVLVNFVDYGYSMKTEKNHVRSITPQLLALPFQAIRCRLAGVEPVGSEWSSEALLWFQTLIDGEQLSARVLSVSGQGYEVKLESRGQDVAAALIAEQLAKAPGAAPKETRAATGPGAKPPVKTNETESGQMHPQACNPAGSASKEAPTEATVTPSEGQLESASFPVDWKTVELPLNETFQPYIVAVTSPSLFYLLSPSQVDQQKLQGVMRELAAYCSSNQASSSPAALSRPAPGAACCARFPADNNWYRAVVLKVGDGEMCVTYADYGNTEKVPFSHIWPIPVHLLQLPFQIIRCTLTGKEHFPAEWPTEVQQMFQDLLLKGVLATVRSFDGSANVLSLTLPAGEGGGDVTAMVLEALQAKSKPCPSSVQEAEQTAGSTSAAAAAVPDCKQPKSAPETQNGLKNPAAATGQTVATEKTPWTPQQNSAVSANENPAQRIVEQMEPQCKIDQNANDPQTSSCCCQSLKAKVDHLEQLMQLQLSVLKQLLGQKK